MLGSNPGCHLNFFQLYYFIKNLTKLQKPNYQHDSVILTTFESGCSYFHESMILIHNHREGRTESKPDTYNKDRMFVTSFAFCVITFEPIEVQTCSAPQNDRQNLVFVKDIKVVVKKMTRNLRKVIGKPGNSLLCRLHSI